MTSAATQSVELAGGVRIPRVGLGVYQMRRGDETRRAVRAALEVGYRHIDTARAYGNEQDVAAALRDSGVPRGDVFLTTKLWNDDHGYDATLRAFDGSAARLGVEVVDLFLVHWPVPGKRLETWRAFERLLADGRVRAIGVSNYMVNHLDELRARAQVLPSVNQIEVSPFLQQRDVRAACAARGIVVEAYSPLTRGERLDHPVVAAVAERRRRTAAQVLLRWGLQRGMVVLSKSAHADRIAENAALFDFELDERDLAELDALEEGLVTGWDPRGAP
jgi:diketogulonate reductase-like aldo/keto reductase